MDWSLLIFVQTTIIVSLGALLQAVTGLGAGLIIVPLLALISFELIPAPLILASMALSGAMAFSGRHHIRYENCNWLLIGISIGTVVAAFIISFVGFTQLGKVFGALLLIAIAISVIAPTIRFSKKTMLGTGATSGFMGTAAGVGAPILALLYQHQSGPSLRATLGFLYFISSIIMLIALYFSGRFGLSQFYSGLLLIPGFVIAFSISPWFTNLVDKGYARGAVLLISLCSAIALLLK